MKLFGGSKCRRKFLGLLKEDRKWQQVSRVFGRDSCASWRCFRDKMQLPDRSPSFFKKINTSPPGGTWQTKWFVKKKKKISKIGSSRSKNGDPQEKVKEKNLSLKSDDSGLMLRAHWLERVHSLRGGGGRGPSERSPLWKVVIIARAATGGWWQYRWTPWKEHWSAEKNIKHEHQMGGHFSTRPTLMCTFEGGGDFFGGRKKIFLFLEKGKVELW